MNPQGHQHCAWPLSQLSCTFYPSAIWQKIPENPPLDSPTASSLRCSPTPTWTNPNTHHHTTISTSLHLKTTAYLSNRQYCCTARRPILLLRFFSIYFSTKSLWQGGVYRQLHCFSPIQYSSVVQSRHVFLPCIYCCIFSLVSHYQIVCTFCTPVYHHTTLCCTMILKKQHFLPVFIGGMI